MFRLEGSTVFQYALEKLAEVIDKEIPAHLEVAAVFMTDGQDSGSRDIPSAMSMNWASMPV